MANKTRDFPAKEDELLSALADEIGNPLDLEYDEEDMIATLEAIGKIPGALALFRSMMGRDIKLYFQAQTDVERAQIKGGYARLAYIRGIIKNIDQYKSIANRKKKRES